MQTASRWRYTKGSPPHTRGKVILNSSFRISARITPAHAGKSCTSTIQRYTGRDHPRTRGEKLRQEDLAAQIQGSPPHTRGKVPDMLFPVMLRRITPAHAGKSFSCIVFPPFIRDHPRTRGEKRNLQADFATGKGSPPHTRGKGTMTINEFAAEGITPAHAGKSALHSRPRKQRQDHPRTRGEK